jgi:hypothetical protein
LGAAARAAAAAAGALTGMIDFMDNIRESK